MDKQFYLTMTMNWLVWDQPPPVSWYLIPLLRNVEKGMFVCHPIYGEASQKITVFLKWSAPNIANCFLVFGVLTFFKAQLSCSKVNITLMLQQWWLIRTSSQTFPSILRASKRLQSFSTHFLSICSSIYISDWILLFS
jgi:hypothetical protein